MRTVGALIALTTTLWVTTAFAEKLMRPVSVQKARLEELQTAGVPNIWKPGQHVAQVGVTATGAAILTVSSPDLATPAVVSARLVRERSDNFSYWTVNCKALKPDQISQLKLVNPDHAMKAALHNGGAFRSVKGPTQFAGVSKNGQSYKLVVTPEKPVEVKLPYGTWTVTELTRYVRVDGRGESARPTGASKFTYQP